MILGFISGHQIDKIYEDDSLRCENGYRVRKWIVVRHILTESRKAEGVSLECGVYVKLHFLHFCC